MPRLLRFACSLALLFGGTGAALAQPFVIDDAARGGGPNADGGDGVALAADGSRYVVGTFEGTATFGDISITSAGDSDIFLVKYDANLDAVWARRAGTDVFNDFGGAVAVAPDGSVYATGYFTGIATWDGGDNPDGELTTFSDFDAFIAKYTPDGDLAWVRQAGGVDQDTGRDVAVDADGNAYLVGGFAGTGMFGDVTLESAGSSDAFLVKYAPDGEVVWARRAGSDQGDLAYGVAVTDDGRAHVSGSFRGVALFGDLPIQSAGATDVFVVQYDADGEATWVEGIGADGSEFTRGGGIGLGSDGSVYVQGSFSNTILVGNDVLVSQGFTDVFVAKLDSDGDELWGRRGGGDGTNFSAALAVDANGNALATGYVDGTGTFADEPIATQGRDGYFAVFDSAGDLVTVELLGGTGQDAGTGIAARADRFAATGSFRGTASFGDLDLTSTGGSDVFVIGGPGETFVPSLLFVDVDATGSETGLSWDDAFTDLQDALALAATIDFDTLDIWVSEGIYYPSDFDRHVPFELITGVSIYGGFTGVETMLEARDPEANETVLNGNIGSPDDAFDNSYHVVVALDVDGGRLDGLTITEGTGNGMTTSTTGEYDSRGGGLQAIDSRLDIDHCIFRSNRAYGPTYFGLGGGLYAENAEISISNTLFDSNTAIFPGKGGGIHVESTSLLLTNVAFEFNTASVAGGGLSAEESSLDISGSRFSDNSAIGSPGEMSSGGDGGGAYVLNSLESGTLTNTTFERNRANASGGGWYAKFSAITYRSLLFSENVAEFAGGGIRHDGYLIDDFDEVTMLGNVASLGAGLHTNGGDAVIRRSHFVRNIADSGSSALSLLGTDGYVVSTIFSGNVSTSGPVVDFGQQTGPSVANALFVGNSTDGGIFDCAMNRIDFTGSAVVSNVSLNGGVGGISAGFQCQVETRNAIVWQNEGAQASSDVDISHSLVQGGFSGTAILNADPEFVRTPTPGPDEQWGTADDDYGDLRLQEGSPAIDFGIAEFLPPDILDLDEDGDTEEPLPVDLDGGARVQGNEIDLGAYESPFAVALEPGLGVPAVSSLAAAYPNPFSQSTTLALDVAEAQNVTVELFDVLGRRVVTVHDGPLSVGDHRVVIESRGLPAGVYVVRAEGETFSQSHRVTLVR